MRAFALSIFLLLVLCNSGPARDWMGVKRPQRKADSLSQRRPASPIDSQAPAGSIPPSAPSSGKGRPADTVFLSRKVRLIPVEEPGVFIGMLEGVRCFNCTPQTMQVALSDSLTKDAGYLSMRLEIWNSIERPVRDRHVFDHGNSCFTFGQKEKDTVLVGGEMTEIRHPDKPCYPYLQKVLKRTPDPVPPVPAPQPPAPPDTAAPDTGK